MSGILGRILMFKVRKRRRYRAKEGLYVVMENFIEKNQIGDISLGGLSFYYVDNGMPLKKSHYDLRVTASSPSASTQIPCQTVSDTEAGEFIFQNKKIKRRSVKFQRLSQSQKMELKHIINDHTLGHL